MSGFSGSGGTATDATITFSDITTNNSSTSNHGFLKKLDNNAAHFMDGTGAWSTPGGVGGSTLTLTIETSAASTQNPAASTLYFFSNLSNIVSTEASMGGGIMVAPVSCTVTAAAVLVRVAGTLASAGTATFTLRKFSTSDYGTLVAGVGFTAATNVGTASGLSLAVTAGDILDVKFTSPAWSPTTPTTVSYTVVLYASVP